MRPPAPIALFCFRRLPVLRETVASLQRNLLASESHLFIFSDGPRLASQAEEVDAVRRFIRTIDGFAQVTIVERPTNIGLQENIVRGVTDVVNRHGRVIVLEDDLVTGRGFLRFMNDSLTAYEDDASIISVLGYSYFSVPRCSADHYFVSRQADCLGWATWKRGWDLFEHDGADALARMREGDLEHDFDRRGAYPYTRMLRHQAKGLANSWAIRWYATAFLHAKSSIYPQRSLVLHVGNSSDGTNYDVGAKDPLDVPLYDGVLSVQTIAPAERVYADDEYRAFVRTLRQRSLASMLRKTLALPWRQPVASAQRVWQALTRVLR